ncbi:MAG: quinolinate synthase NadA [Candidatus Schekmanbacteria bacterium]|nr:quinolinate synthase NadA [Candidatus Schekmanbacteria bacterium]
MTATATAEMCAIMDEAIDTAALVSEIRTLKAARDAVILAHNYMIPEIFQVADVVGDSLDLSLQAAKVEKPVIVFCGVHFMAETAKLVNPTRLVLLPDLRAGCSLADAADATDVADRIDELRALHGDDLAVVCYVNTTAAVKACCDACCTSANAPAIVRKLPARNILFLPDANLAGYVQRHVPEKRIIAWEGNCYVHQQIEPDEIRKIRDAIPGIVVLVHPECRQDVCALADAVLSTSQMVVEAKARPETEFLVVTECGLSGRLELEVPEKSFYRACKLCRYMKMISLENVRDSLWHLRHAIEIPEAVAVPARRSIERMFELMR